MHPWNTRMPPTPASHDKNAPAEIPAFRDDSTAPDIPGHPFKAVADFAELGDKFQPGPAWSGRTLRISSSNLVFQSRRMCYCGRTLAAAIHRVDSAPMGLVGTVSRCEYAGEGQYLVVLALMPRPAASSLDNWFTELARALARMA